ncbi:DUF6600 domain-containing protein [Niabella sp.]|uniref:DUF6600 domain-containing protein n=1 Tax=Niabella sp. TaxID=1962976 RepID=UPI002612D90F|nr:DUF6600 domain-containing protein [Niabella sp.]
MKTKKFRTWIKLLLFGIILSSCTASYQTQAQVVAPDGTITYQTFYDDLSPYGSWINYPGYGNVWHPSLGADFRPYATGGHWVYSDEGWAWASDYGWGWAPFHYGRWLYDDLYGWLWVPGYDWSPAWVTWGYTGNYYCWAPLMPGISVSSAFGSWRPHSIYWNAVERGHIYDRNLTRVVQGPSVVNNIHNNITIINNFNTTKTNNNYYSRGPRVTDVQQFTKTQINPVSITQHDRNMGNPRKDNANNRVDRGVPAQHNELNMYRPRVQQPPANNVRAPQPKEFKQVARNNTRPIQSINDRPMGQRQEQISNVDRLPRQTGIQSGGRRGSRR